MVTAVYVVFFFYCVCGELWKLDQAVPITSRRNSDAYKDYLFAYSQRLRWNLHVGTMASSLCQLRLRGIMVH